MPTTKEVTERSYTHRVIVGPDIDVSGKRERGLRGGGLQSVGSDALELTGSVTLAHQQHP